MPFADDPDRYPGLIKTIRSFASHSAAASTSSAAIPSAIPSAILGYPTRHGNERKFFDLVGHTTDSSLVVGQTLPLQGGQAGASTSSGGGLAVTYLLHGANGVASVT